MSVCVSVDSISKALSLDESETNCIYQILTTAEINQLNGLNGLFAAYFDFDTDLFALLTGGSILAWVTGYTMGRMMGAWRKVM